MVSISFEFFPPMTPEGRSRLNDVAVELSAYDPAFVSVTYGAGGTSQERTLRTVADLTEALSVPVAGHLTTVGASRDHIHRVIDDYRTLGVGHIVALRGDPQDDDSPPPGYGTAVELVSAIRGRSDGADFEISVAAYPEVHPRAASAEADLENLKRKIDAGADRAITQFFFDPDLFLRFRDRAAATGIEVPIVPGIMPITNFSGVRKFAGKCGTAIPPWLAALFDGLDDDPEVHQLVAATIAAEQCKRLIDGGIEAFHIYTMNRRHLSAAIAHTLGLPRRVSTGSNA